MNGVFYLSTAVAILATMMVVTRLNAVHALLYLIVSFFSVALIFFTLGAPFVAALEIIVYAGAIMVLFVFVIMMLNLGPSSKEQESVWLKPNVWIGPSLLAGILILETNISDGFDRGPDNLSHSGNYSQTGWDSAFWSLCYWC